VSKSHFLYFVSAARRSAVKIGITQDVKHRLLSLQGGNHTKLAIELVLRMPDKQSAYLLEDALHQHFAAHWRRSEWFDYAPPLRDYVDRWNRREVVKIPYPRRTCKQITIDEQGSCMRKAEYLSQLRAAARRSAAA